MSGESTPAVLAAVNSELYLSFWGICFKPKCSDPHLYASSS